jgi:hypothetical protein
MRTSFRRHELLGLIVFALLSPVRANAEEGGLVALFDRKTPQQKAAAALIAALESDSEEAQRLATIALPGLSDFRPDQLLPLLDERKVRGCKNACEVLVNKGDGATGEIANRLVTLLNSKKDLVRFSAVRALGVRPSEDVSSALVRGFRTEGNIYVLCEYVRSLMPAVRERHGAKEIDALLDALEKLPEPPKTEEGDEPLFGRNEFGWPRNTGPSAYDRYPGMIAVAVSEGRIDAMAHLKTRLADAKASELQKLYSLIAVRYIVRNQLDVDRTEGLDKASEDLRPTIESYLGDKQKYLRMAAIRTLTEYEARAAKSLPQLTAIAANKAEDAEVRTLAQRAIARITKPPRK